jgi:ELWxxDGT repeat protein
MSHRGHRKNRERVRSGRRRLAIPPARCRHARFELLEDRRLLDATPQLVRDTNLLAAGSSPNNLVAVGNVAYFVANDGTHGSELWKSDGSAAGTMLVQEINTGSANFNYLTNVNGTLFFIANDGTHGGELWKSDGTAAGTVLVADIRPGSVSSYPKSLTNVNGTLFFIANDGTHGNELWKRAVNCASVNICPF